ncbi:hypothetical protein CcaCcLH18_00684 [Colletotrichum camelliae]|nr:hypothetical protein CcaCcLH18_00684 [Colletotrichum camelliae]
MKVFYVICVFVGAFSVSAINLRDYREGPEESQSLSLQDIQETYSINRDVFAARDNPPISGEGGSSAMKFPTSNLVGNLSRVLMTPTTRQWAPEITTGSQTTTFERPVSTLGSTSDSGSYSTTQAVHDSYKTTQPVPTTPAVHDIPTPVSTMTTLPPQLLIQTLTGSVWKENTWVTTTGSDGSPTVVPVIVGCPGCKDRGGGVLLLWNLPQIPNVSFKFPNLPNLPQFFLPCVKVLFVEIGNCPGPVTESTDDGMQQDDQENNSPTPSLTPSKTQSTTSDSSVVSSTEGCQITRTASHCVATCSPITTGRTSTVTCFTTACHATITGCSVSGITSTTTKMPCPTHNNAEDVGRRDLAGYSCPVGCPQWSLSDWKTSDPVDDDQSDAKKRHFALAGRILIPRAVKKNIREIKGCRIETAWPAGKPPVATPAYFSGPEFLEADKVGFTNVDQKRRELSEEVPRWYSLRSAEAPACTPTTVPLTTQDMYDVMQRLKKVGEENPKDIKKQFNNQGSRPSLDHIWEKSWLTEFLEEDILSIKAAPLAGLPYGGAAKLRR